MQKNSKSITDLDWIDLEVSSSELKLENTLNIGQCFSWKRLPSLNSSRKLYWVGTYQNIPIALQQSPSTTKVAYLLPPSLPTLHTREWLKHEMIDYFQLQRDPLVELYALWSQGCDRMKDVIDCMPGVRVVRQDPWECLISFMCSSNNNIGRITLMLDRLRYQYGYYLCSWHGWVRVRNRSISIYIDEHLSRYRQNSNQHYHPPSSLAPAPPSPTLLHHTAVDHGHLDKDRTSLLSLLVSPSPSTAATPSAPFSSAAPPTSSSSATVVVHHLFSFPTIEDFAFHATEEKLRSLGMGYRAKFLVNSTQFLVSQPEGGLAWLHRLRSWSTTAEQLTAASSASSSVTAADQQIKVKVEMQFGHSSFSSPSSSSSSSSLQIKEEEEEEAGNNLLQATTTIPHSSSKQKKTKKTTAVDDEQILPIRLLVQQQLLQLPGVGPKVADCIALFSLDASETIPVDTHVWSIALRDYNTVADTAANDLQASKSLTPVIYEQVGTIFRQLFTRRAGWAHSVLFATELPFFRERLPLARQQAMKEFQVQQRQEKEKAREEKKKRKLAKEEVGVGGGAAETAIDAADEGDEEDKEDEGSSKQEQQQVKKKKVMKTEPTKKAKVSIKEEDKISTTQSSLLIKSPQQLLPSSKGKKGKNRQQDHEEKEESPLPLPSSSIRIKLEDEQNMK